MKRFLLLALAATCLALPAAAQNAPEIAYDSVANPLSLPDDIYLGETAGVATNSQRRHFCLHADRPSDRVSRHRAPRLSHGGSRLFQFDRNGKFVREIGADSYAFLFAQQVRIDPQDNIWVVDQMSNTVLKFDPEGHVALILGRKAEAIPVPARGPGAAGAPFRRLRLVNAIGAGAQSDLFNRPADVAWDGPATSTLPTESATAAVAKFDKNGVFIRSWGSKGTEPGQFAAARAIASTLKGMSMSPIPATSASRSFDGDGKLKSADHQCRLAAGAVHLAGTNQVLYSSNSNPPNDIDTAGDIYKLKLDGTVIGKFGRAGRLPKEFNFVNAIDCRNENTLYVGEIGNLRVQKVTLH